DADADADADTDSDSDSGLEVAEASDLVVDESNGLYTSASGNVHLLGDSTIQSVTLFAPDAIWADNMLTANDGSYQITMDSTGGYTFTLLKPLYHPDGGEHASETLDFDIGAVVTNEDGVEVNTSFVVSVYDDGPVLTSVEGSASELFEYDLGLDGLGQIVHGIPDITLLSDGEETTLTSNGSPVVFAITDSNNDGLTEIHGFVDEGIPGWTVEDEGREVLSITPHNSAAESGTYVLNFHDVVDLPVDDNGEQETLNLNFDFAGVDGDGDQMLLGTINVQISDAVAIEVFKHPDSVDSTGTGGLGE
ncbi:MAG: hypothetical protein KAG19_04925, partial [Methylococcales bacterium]|nr:hypothetical protein [Methylococcales bacterium]